MFVSCECLIDTVKIYMLLMILIFGSQNCSFHKCKKIYIYFCLRERGPRVKGNRTDGIWGESIAGAVSKK